MKKFLFIMCAAALIGATSCTKAVKECEQTEQEDTVFVVNDTVVVEEFDTVYAE